jgi:hypothetical protein
VTECETEPLLPVIVSVAFVTRLAFLAVIVSVELQDGEVADVGENAAVTLRGRPPTLSATGAESPLTGVIVTV